MAAAREHYGVAVSARGEIDAVATGRIADERHQFDAGMAAESWA